MPLTYDSPNPSAADSPCPGQTATIPLLRDYDTPTETYSPSLPSLPADEKRRAPRWRPSSRAALPVAASLLTLASLLFLLYSLAAPDATYSESPSDAASPRAPAARILQWFHGQPAQPLKEKDFVVVEAKAEHTVTAVVLHGLGGNANDWPFVQTLSARYPYVRWVSPSADYLNVTVRNGESTRGWFDIETFEDLYRNEDVAGYAHSQQQLNRLVAEERQRLVAKGKAPRIAMMGFSQGGVMTLLSLLTAETAERFEAGIVFSAYLPLKDQIEELISPAALDTPILWSHGRADPYLTYQNAVSGIRQLRRSRKAHLRRLTFKGYDGVQHSWGNEELADMANWFGQNVPEHRERDPSSPSLSHDASRLATDHASPSPPSEQAHDAARKPWRAAPPAEDVEPASGEAVEENAVEQIQEAVAAAELPVKKLRLARTLR
ncbi:hypothetical protein JCM10213_004908 [Rhodosporidiobolus nylandii]